MIEWLSGWYNWLFLFPLALGVIFILVDLFLGGLSELIGIGADLDLDAGHKRNCLFVTLANAIKPTK